MSFTDILNARVAEMPFLNPGDTIYSFEGQTGCVVERKDIRGQECYKVRWYFSSGNWNTAIERREDLWIRREDIPAEAAQWGL